MYFLSTTFQFNGLVATECKLLHDIIPNNDNDNIAHNNITNNDNNITDNNDIPNNILQKYIACNNICNVYILYTTI